MNFCARLLVIRGKVQGVFFRESMRQLADELEVTGWVRNRRDGSVEAFIQGDLPSLEELIQWAQQGPPAARVQEVLCEEASPDTSCVSFERRETV